MNFKNSYRFDRRLSRRYDAKGNAKYATERTCLPDDTVEMNKKFVGRVQMLGHVAAAVVGAVLISK